MYYNHEIGKTGEKIASRYLSDHGQQVLDYNWRSGKSEIDIIANDHGTLVFVEVKTRTTQVFGNPESALDDKKMKNLIRGATDFCRLLDHQGEIRFDLISIILEPKLEVLHFKDAFFPEW